MHVKKSISLFFITFNIFEEFHNYYFLVMLKSKTYIWEKQAKTVEVFLKFLWEYVSTACEVADIDFYFTEMLILKKDNYSI